jgi:hypothetical protein
LRSFSAGAGLGGDSRPAAAKPLPAPDAPGFVLDDEPPIATAAIAPASATSATSPSTRRRSKPRRRI